MPLAPFHGHMQYRQESPRPLSLPPLRARAASEGRGGGHRSGCHTHMDFLSASSRECAAECCLCLAPAGSCIDNRRARAADGRALYVKGTSGLDKPLAHRVMFSPVGTACRLSSMVEHPPCKRKVMSSSLLAGTILAFETRCEGLMNSSLSQNRC